jgi:hypothetical protein
MLEVRAHNFHFDSAQMPLNILDAQFRSFANEVPKLVEQRDRGARNEADVRRRASARGLATGVECLHYALTLPTSVVITGSPTEDSRPGIRGCAYVRRYRGPAGAAGQDAQAALSGKLETFKTTTRQDGTARNPQWMG